MRGLTKTSSYEDNSSGHIRRPAERRARHGGQAAVGLGNIWRFPYVAGENGGGAFLLIYILSVLLLGVPIMLSEFAIGRNTHRNAVGAYRTLSSRWSILGYNSILAPLLIMGFYLVVSGWTLEYMTSRSRAEFTRISTPEAYESLFNCLHAEPVENRCSTPSSSPC